DSRYPTERRQAIGRQIAKRFPGSFELIDLTNQPKEIRSKYQIFQGIETHIRKYTRKYPIVQSGVCGYICGYRIYSFPVAREARARPPRDSGDPCGSRIETAIPQAIAKPCMTGIAAGCSPRRDLLEMPPPGCWARTCGFYR